MSRETTTGSATTTTKRARLATTNVFERAQIKEFQVAFNLIDRNRDGLIDKDDLRDTLISLGTCARSPCSGDCRSRIHVNVECLFLVQAKIRRTIIWKT